jgi:hypothetical protein
MTLIYRCSNVLTIHFNGCRGELLNSLRADAELNIRPSARWQTSGLTKVFGLSFFLFDRRSCCCLFFGKINGNN